MKSLKIILPIGICICVITGFATRNVRQESEKELSKQELISGSANKYVLAERKAREDFTRKLKEDQEAREFKRFLGSR